jgi:phage terminase large subunit
VNPSKFNIDWSNPDYKAIFQWRAHTLGRLRADPEQLPAIKGYYRENPWDFIEDWGITIDPKLVERQQPSIVPFILFPRQREWIEWVVERWHSQTPGITEKTRQMGFSWLSMALSCTLCLFNDGMVIGFGSRKEEYVDKHGDLKSLFEKARQFMNNLPIEFRAGWTQRNHAPHMRLIFPETQSFIGGEAGSNIGRGATTSLYFVDEAAFIEHPEQVDAALSQTTNCRLDISTPNGMANPFAYKRFSGNISVFTFGWRDDPRKDDEWYAKQVKELSPVVVAQEIDINYSASVEGIVIPAVWIQSAIDAHLKLQVPPTGERLGALDVADEGTDKNAFCIAQGIYIEQVQEWSGAGSDIFATTLRAFRLCDEFSLDGFRYDGDGMGAGVRGDARILNDNRELEGKSKLRLDMFRGSGAVVDPDRPISPDIGPRESKPRLNKDYFKNAKAQSWFELRWRFEKTHLWVTEDIECDPDEIIALNAKMEGITQLIGELSQATYQVDGTGKIVIDKTPDGARSPNRADAIMMRYARVPRRMAIDPNAYHKIVGRTTVYTHPEVAKPWVKPNMGFASGNRFNQVGHRGSGFVPGGKGKFMKGK